MAVESWGTFFFGLAVGVALTSAAFFVTLRYLEKYPKAEEVLKAPPLTQAEEDAANGLRKSERTMWDGKK